MTMSTLENAANQIIDSHSEAWQQVGMLRQRLARVAAERDNLLKACKLAMSIIDAEHEACRVYQAHQIIIRAAIADAEHKG